MRNGIWLGKWLYRLRRIRRNIEAPAGEAERLTPERATRLEALGMDWRTPAERVWDAHYADAKRYYEAHGNLRVPYEYKTENGSLRRWLDTQRRLRATGGGTELLTPERIARLDVLGFEWEPRSRKDDADKRGRAADGAFMQPGM